MVVLLTVGHRDRVVGAFFSNDGQSLYTVARDGAIFTWSAETVIVPNKPSSSHRKHNQQRGKKRKQQEEEEEEDEDFKGFTRVHNPIMVDYFFGYWEKK